MSMPHICTVQHENSRTFLPYEESSKNVLHRFLRCFRDWCLVWKEHPQFSHFYRSTTAYLIERKSHASSKYFYIIHPLSKLCFSVEMFLMVCYPFAFMYYPLAASFFVSESGYTTEKHIAEETLQIIFTLEIIVRIFMGRKYFRLKEVTINHKKIIKSYISSAVFIGDVCGAIPLYSCIPEMENKMILTPLAMVRFLKVLRLRTFLEYSHDVIKLIGLSSYYGAINSSVIIALCVHWFTCAYYGIKILGGILRGNLEENYGSIYYFKAINVTGSSYIESAFRTMGMLVSAKRDTGMKREIEHKAMVVLFLVCGRILLMILGVLIMNRILRAAELQTKYRGILEQLNEFMNRKKLPVATRNRLLDFYEYKFQGKFVKEAKIENVLTERLKKEIYYHSSNKLIKQVQIFEDIPTKILAEIVSHLKSEVFLPNDIIISAGSHAECMYFISSGTVCVTTASGREVCHLQDGGYFGEAALVLNHKKSISNVTALEICETYRLDSKPFRHCFKNYPEIFQKLKAEAEKRETETMKLEEEFQEKLFFKTYLGDKRRLTFESHDTGDS